MVFEFGTVSKIIFERGAVKRLPALCSPYGSAALIIASSGAFARDALDGLAFKNKGISATYYCCEKGEPTVESVDKAALFGKNINADVVIGIGGGSAIDTAKAAAAMITNAGSVRDYLEGAGNGEKIKYEPLPFIAVPATSGTGAEATKNAVILSRAERFKKSFRDERLFAKIALLDSELTVSSPKCVTASSGMDAICQLIESFTAKNSNPFCDAMALHFIPSAINALKRAYDDGENMEARETMALSSIVSGICLTNAGLGAAHGIGAGLGAYLGTPHGAACGMLLPHVIRYNIARGYTKYSEIAGRVFSRVFSDAVNASLALADELESLCAYLGLPLRLRDLGVTANMAPDIAKASMGSSMSRNPVAVSQEECEKFILSII